MDWLAADHPEWAVWTLDYTADMTNWQAKGFPKRRGPGMAISELATTTLDVLRNHHIGDRPAIFITHSLGGLVVKDLLRIATTEGFADHQALATNTVGVAFLATPHFGSALASAVKYLPSLARATRKVLELEAHSDALKQLNDWYRQNAPKLGIATASYAESQPLSGTVVVVNRTSADPNVPDVKTVGIADADHSTIAKPTNRNAQIFMSVERFIAEAVQPRGGDYGSKASAAGVKGVKKVLRACYRRAIFARFQAQMSHVAMFNSLAECRTTLQKLVVLVQPESSQRLVAGIIGDLDLIERRRESVLSYRDFRSDEELINSAKLRIIRALLDLRDAAAISLPLPTSVTDEMFWSERDASRKPQGEVSA